VRAAHGLGGLRLEQGLEEAAVAHSAEMLADGSFGHDSADGQHFWQHIEHFHPEPAKGGCLACGARRPLTAEDLMRSDKCPRCGYLGWTDPDALTNTEREALRRARDRKAFGATRIGRVAIDLSWQPKH
jgi:hypothetical protein